jgi:hypothetical protein
LGLPPLLGEVAFVSRYQVVRLGRFRAFQKTVVGWIAGDFQAMTGMDNAGYLLKETQ